MRSCHLPLLGAMTDPSELARAKKSRAGHRAGASKTMQKVEEELTDNPKPNKQKLQQFRQSLQLKLQTLDALNEADRRECRI